ncbi:MAG: RedB protein [Verrucomicrobia bacterium]|nr:RedB protein [Verrucomicrobiota bacterium]
MSPAPNSPQGRRFLITAVAGALWLGLIVAVMVGLLKYSNLPGRAGVPPASWPGGSVIVRDEGRPTLILFAHPHCPCTQATLGELEQLLARCGSRVRTQVWFIKPAGVTDAWMDTDLWRKAAAIPGVTVHRDETGREARRFQVETSGQALLYDRDGRLLFAGGITLARGHAGDNPGRSALTALLENTLSGKIKTPVFGCSLFEAECVEKDVCK